MEILHLGKYYWPARGGIETATKNLAELGSELGHQVSCAVSDARMHAPLTEVVGAVQVTRYPIQARMLSAPLSFGLFRYPTRDTRILHVHLPHPMAELMVLGRILFSRRRKFAIAPYFHAFPTSQGLLGKLWYRMVTRKILARSRAILVSNANITTAFPMLGEWEGKIRVLPFHIDAWTDAEHAAARNARDRSKEFLAVGRLVPYKGFDVLVRAWAQARARSGALDGYRLRIVGDGPQKGELTDLIRAHGLDGSISLVGGCDDDAKEGLLRTATVFVAPSVSDAETFGISILEALARGLPVITTGLKTGVSVLSRGGRCGAAVAPASVSELSEALIALASQSATARFETGRANLDFARANYSRRNTADAYSELIDAIERAA